MFPNFEGSIYDTPEGGALRNATVTTIAPTGTLSIIANCSSGIEPLFAVSYVRTVMDNDRLIEVNPIFEDIAVKQGFYSRELMGADRRARLGARHRRGARGRAARVRDGARHRARCGTSGMQAAFQKYTDNAVSKTVNFGNEATVEDVREVYDLAYELGREGRHDLPRRQQGEPGPLDRQDARRATRAR